MFKACDPGAYLIENSLMGLCFAADLFCRARNSEAIKGPLVGCLLVSSVLLRAEGRAVNSR